MSELRCSRCKQMKDPESFTRNKARPNDLRGGRQYICKACSCGIQAARRAAGGYRKIDRKKHLRRKFGIDETRYENILARQGGGCGVCGKPPTPTAALCVDHDHETNEIRGLLCSPCNRALGSLGDSVEGLERAIRYLNHGGKANG